MLRYRERERESEKERERERERKSEREYGVTGAWLVVAGKDAGAHKDAEADELKDADEAHALLLYSCLSAVMLDESSLLSVSWCAVRSAACVDSAMFCAPSQKSHLSRLR